VGQALAIHVQFEVNFGFGSCPVQTCFSTHHASLSDFPTK
jgi:hypothetical protein